LRLFPEKEIKRHLKWWFVCLVDRGKERIFRRDLARRGILNFAPVGKVAVHKKGVVSWRTNYLFPGYVFVCGSDFKEFIFEKRIKGFRSIMNNNGKEFRLQHFIVADLIERQLNNEFDFSVRRTGDDKKFMIGEKVQIIGAEKLQFPRNTVGTILSMGKEEAAILLGNRVWKIKFCYLRK